MVDNNMHYYGYDDMVLSLIFLALLQLLSSPRFRNYLLSVILDIVRNVAFDSKEKC